MLRVIVATLVLMFAFAFVALQSGNANATVPASASIITNTASASYVDGGMIPRNTTSNTVSTTVSQVNSFTLTAPGFKTSPISQQVCYAHTITNTGNGADTYTLNSPTAGGAFNHTSMYYAPDNAGMVGVGMITTSGVISAIAGSNTFNFWVCGTVPGTAMDAQIGTITVSVVGTAAPIATVQTNLDTTTVSSSAVQVVKSLVTTPPSGGVVTGGPSPSGQLYVNLHYTVNGTAAATNLTLTDILPAGMNYGAVGLARWGVVPMNALTEANDGFEQMQMSGNLDFRQTGPLTAATVTVVISTVAAGQSGDVWFPVTIASGLSPQAIINTASYTTTQNPTASNSNPATYTVGTTRGVVANNNTGSPVNTAPDNLVSPTSSVMSMTPLTTASPGQTIVYKNYIWNTGNAADSYTIAVLGGPGTCAIGNGAAPACNFPAGTTFQLFQADGITPLPQGGGTNTGLINPSMSYIVVMKATLPANAPSGNNGGAGYHVDKTALSSDGVTIDPVTDTLASISPLTVDITNNTGRCDSTPAGTASDGTGIAACTMAGNTVSTTGFGAGTMTPIITNMVTPAASMATSTTFRLLVNNTSLVPDSYSLTSSAPPAGWGVVFNQDGGMGNCSTLGVATVTTGTIAGGANKLICAVVSIPAVSSGNAPPGTTNFTFTVANGGTATDFKVDAVTVNQLHDVIIDAGTSGQTVPGGSLVYSHIITNRGNIAETITFLGAYLADSNMPWAPLSELYLDTNGNGTYEVGTDTLITNATSFSLPAAGGMNTHSIFTVVQAPMGAMPGDINQSTITAQYNAGAGMLTTFDTTTVTDGLLLEKYQQTTACGVTPTATFSMAGVPNAPWSKNAITSSAATAPGQCIAYLIVANNKSSLTVTNVVISDTLPSMSPILVLNIGCGVPTASAPGGAPTGPNMTGQTGTISTTAPSLGSSAFFSLRFCVMINNM